MRRPAATEAEAEQRRRPEPGRARELAPARELGRERELGRAQEPALGRVQDQERVELEPARERGEAGLAREPDRRASRELGCAFRQGITSREVIP